MSQFSFLTIFFFIDGWGQRPGNGVPKGVMASSRVHMPPRLSSTPELIHAAGQWTRCRAFSACLGRGAALFVPGPLTLHPCVQERPQACVSVHHGTHLVRPGWRLDGPAPPARKPCHGGRGSVPHEARGARPCVQLASGPLTAPCRTALPTASRAPGHPGQERWELQKPRAHAHRVRHSGAKVPPGTAAPPAEGPGPLARVTA